ncbi:PepSY domain-containing protein [Hirschia litorea]|uniref:PepSY domain-containing protein n=1 Tax=Hirschia litorea TaxID=1199156 RepID=A0ABW2IH45_9PROT
MSLISSESLKPYPNMTSAGFNAADEWPDIADLKQVSGWASKIVLSEQKIGGLLHVSGYEDKQASKWITPDTLSAAPKVTEEDARRIATALTGEDLSDAKITVKEKHTPEYSRGILPIWRVEAEKAALFIDMQTGALRSQGNLPKRLETIFKSIHTMDYSMLAKYKDSGVLTVFAVIFLATALLGILPVRRVHAIKGGGLRILRWHQAIGIVLALQVVFWVTSGLSVVWLLERADKEGAQITVQKEAPIDWERVQFHPKQLNHQADIAPTRITLTSLLGEPVYRLAWQTPNILINFMDKLDQQKAFSAESGQEIKLTEADRDRLVQWAVSKETADSIKEWEIATTYDEYFAIGPFPVWKGHFEEPQKGVLSIDQVTGQVHRSVRTVKRTLIAEYYKTHVAQYWPGDIKYRRQPLLLLVIGSMMVLVVCGMLIHIRRWKADAKRKKKLAEKAAKA